LGAGKWILPYIPQLSAADVHGTVKVRHKEAFREPRHMPAITGVWGNEMPNTETGSIYSEAIAMLQRALALCDEAAVGKTAAPHLDLALNLLLAEYQASRILTPVQS